MDKALLLSILSMDAYNRGYNPGINSLSDDQGTGVGGVEVLFRLENVSTDFAVEAEAADFYAIAYKVTAENGIAGFQKDDVIISGC